MNENKVERQLVCEGENCHWGKAAAEASASASRWQFSPEKLEAAEVWHWHNKTAYDLTLRATLNLASPCITGLDNLWWLRLTTVTEAKTGEASASEQLVKEGRVQWQKNATEEETFQVKLKAGEEKALRWHWSHPGWNYLQSQKWKNQTLAYDWLLKIEGETEKVIAEASESGQVATKSATVKEKIVPTVAEEKEALINNYVVNNYSTEVKTVTEKIDKESEKVWEKSESESEKNESEKNGQATQASGSAQRLSEVQISEPQVLGAATTQKNFGWSWWWLWLLFILIIAIVSGYLYGKTKGFKEKKVD